MATPPVAEPPPQQQLAMTIGSGGNSTSGAPHLPGLAVPADVDIFRHQIDTLISKVDEAEKRVKEVTKFYDAKNTNDLKGSSEWKEKDKGYNSNNNAGGCSAGNHAGVVARRTKRMQELMRQFGTILKTIAAHRWAWPFLEPVDVEGLGLHDYYKIIRKPMDLGTIRNWMEEKDGSHYRNVREIYADARLVFTNAMTYNDERNDIHVMAKTLMEKLEERWLQLLPKVVEEEKRQLEKEAQSQANMLIAQEAAIAKMASDAENELNMLNKHLDELRELVVHKCRKMSTEEKRKLGTGLSNLSPEDINKALEIIAQSNPNFQATSEEVNLDMDEQSETALWRLKFFVKEALELQTKSSKSKVDETSKRKREICDALAKTIKKRNKPLS